MGKRVYSKPEVEKMAFQFENQVTATSSGGCYSTTAFIHQTPQTGRGDYRIQVNGQHHADHTRNAQVLHISFNQPVVYKSCGANGASLIAGNSTTNLEIALSYYQNPNDNIGFGDLCVESDPGLAITGVSITD